MVTDLFLTKKSVVGLAERVSLTPPPDYVQCYLSESQDGKLYVNYFGQDEIDLLNNLKLGQLASIYIDSGGNCLLLQPSFFAIVQKNSTTMCSCFGCAPTDDGTSIVLFCFRFNIETGRIDRGLEYK